MTTASGALSKAQDYMADMLAAGSAFQDWVGADDSTEAAARIYQDALPAPADGNAHSLAELQGYRPYALIWTEPSGGFSRDIDSAGSGNFFRDNGRVRVMLEQDVPTAAESDVAEAELLWRNTVGDIIDDLSELAGVAGYLSVTHLSVDGPHRTHPDDVDSIGNSQYVQIAFDWGP